MEVLLGIIFVLRFEYDSPLRPYINGRTVVPGDTNVCRRASPY